MSTKLSASALAAVVLLASVASACADKFGTPQQARAMLDRAVTALKADPAKALKEFNNNANKDFHDRDLFVTCFGMPDGKFTAYQSPFLLGANVREFKIKDDPIGQRGYDAIAKAPEGTVVTLEYSFPKPGEKKFAPKESLEARVGDQACSVSYFK